ncbi:MAG: hypothetical protein QXS85_01065 [Acidilobaceae archaeon]
MGSQIVERIAFILLEYISAIDDAKLVLALAQSSDEREVERIESKILRLRELRRGLGESIDSLIVMIGGEAELDEEVASDLSSLLNYYLIVAYNDEREILEYASSFIDVSRDLEELRGFKNKIERVLEKVSEAPRV